MSMSACERCFVALPPGTLRFRVSMVVHGETGGELPGEAGGSPEDALTRALRAAEAMTEEELMADVAEDFTFVLCPACRARLRADPASCSTVKATHGAPRA